MILNIFSHSADQTFSFAYAIGQSIDQPRTFLLQGALGVGKTVFCKGLICGLGVDDPADVTSPSFTLINEYQGRMPVFHIDLYRIKGEDDIWTLGLEEIFEKPAVVLVEWPEKLVGYDSEDKILVEMADLGGENRHIELINLEKIEC